MAQVRTPQMQGMVVSRISAQQVRANQERTMTVYNIPAEQMRTTAAYHDIVYRRQAQGLDVQQATAMVLWRGRIEDPRLRAWTFTLDNHDFYVLRLGNNATLVYDTLSEQWFEWGNATGPLWWVNTGISWLGAGGLAHEYGSSIVVGDDTLGQLWFMDPEQPFDEALLPDNPVQQVPFNRIVTGQVPVVGRDVLPCFAFFLATDNRSVATAFSPNVRLEISDDAGKTFYDYGYLDVNEQASYEWLSLGQFGAPGRLFRVTDNGAFARIDGAEMNDGE